MMARATHDKNDDVGHQYIVLVTFDEASCTNPVRWASTTTGFWHCPCCKRMIAPGETHQCPVRPESQILDIRH